MGTIDWTTLITEGIRGAVSIIIASLVIVVPAWLIRKKGVRERKSYQHKVDVLTDNIANNHQSLLRDDVDVVNEGVEELHDRFDDVVALVIKAVNRLESMNRRMDRHRKSLDEQNRISKQQLEINAQMDAKVAAIAERVETLEGVKVIIKENLET